MLGSVKNVTLPVGGVPVARAPVARAPVARAPVARAPVARAPVARAVPVAAAAVTPAALRVTPVTAMVATATDAHRSNVHRPLRLTWCVGRRGSGRRSVKAMRAEVGRGSRVGMTGPSARSISWFTASGVMDRATLHETTGGWMGGPQKFRAGGSPREPGDLTPLDRSGQDQRKERDAMVSGSTR